MNLKAVYLITLVISLSSWPKLAAQQSKLPNPNRVLPGSYRIDSNGEYSTETNADEFWRSGAWKENTNGWRVLICSWDTNTSNPRISVAIGSKVANSGGGYFGTPNGKFAKIELVDSNGIVIPPIKGTSIEDLFFNRISTRSWPKWPDGGLKNRFGFFSNSPPAVLREFKVYDIYNVVHAGDYTLTACPVVYRHETNAEYLDRIDLPCVSTKIHLLPKPEKY